MTSFIDIPTGPAALRVLIVQSDAALGADWAQHLEGQGLAVTLAATADAALKALRRRDFHAIILDMVLSDGNALIVADIAAFRQPGASVICVTDDSFFSDGSIFNHCATARLMLERGTPPEELAAIVSHYGARSTTPVR